MVRTPRPTPLIVVNEDEIQSLLERAQGGELEALNLLFTELSTELRRIVQQMRRQRSGSSMRTTEVMHEAFLKLFRSPNPGFTNQEHLLAMWANAVGWVVIEARRRKGRRPQLDQLVEETMSPTLHHGDFSSDAIASAFEALQQAKPKEAIAAELRLLAGLSTQDISLLLDRSEQTIRAWVRTATAWIHLYVENGPETPASPPA